MEPLNKPPIGTAETRMRAWFELRYAMLELLAELEYLALMLRLGVRSK